MLEAKRSTVSIIIKAFNEEHHIAGAIESALAALDGLDGEVILADGASTDQTVAIAQNYPIKIVRLANAEDRSCGAGAQLGYQYSAGKFLCLIDGDMRLHKDFVAAGLRFLEENPTVGGVGGAVIDRDGASLEYQQRTKRSDPDRRPGPVTRLNCSGLYRRSAIETVGYVTDRNLHSGEELDLGARLQTRGWTLERLDCLAIDHYGNPGNAFVQLLRRIKTRNAFGVGEIMRAAIGQPHLRFLIRNERIFLLCGFIAAWWSGLVAAPLLARGLDAVIMIAVLGPLPFLVMWIRWRSFNNAVYSIAACEHLRAVLFARIFAAVGPTHTMDSQHGGARAVRRTVSRRAHARCLQFGVGSIRRTSVGRLCSTAKLAREGRKRVTSRHSQLHKYKGRPAAALLILNLQFSVHAAAAVFRFLRQPSRPSAPTPVANSGSAGGSGAVDPAHMPGPPLQPSPSTKIPSTRIISEPISAHRKQQN